MQWWDRIIDTKTVNHYASHATFLTEINEILEEEKDHELFSAASTKILDRAHKKVTSEECASAQTHLSAEERQVFKEVLEKYTISEVLPLEQSRTKIKISYLRP